MRLLSVAIVVCGLSTSALARDIPVCTDGKILACFEAARAYARGENVTRDLAKAARYFGIACQGGHTKACYSAGLLYDLGEGGVTRNADRAYKFYAAACEQDYANACAPAAQLTKDPQLALALNKKGCSSGDAMACVETGVTYQLGRGVKANSKTAATFYDKACDDANGTGCYNLALLALDGKGVRKSRRRARTLFDAGCIARHADSCAMAGVLAVKAKDPKSAMARFDSGCKLGSETACQALEQLKN